MKQNGTSNDNSKIKIQKAALKSSSFMKLRFMKLGLLIKSVNRLHKSRNKSIINEHKYLFKRVQKTFSNRLIDLS